MFTNPSSASKPTTASGELWLVVLSGVVTLYGAVGVAIQFALPSLILRSFSRWVDYLLGRQAPTSAPLAGAGGPWETFFVRWPWLPWVAWLVGLGGLVVFGFAAGTSDRIDPKLRARAGGIQRPKEGMISLRWAVTIFALAGLLLLGGYTRFNQIYPEAKGLTYLPYEDEGVYLSASQLLIQGKLPYRDFFFAHPPLAAALLAPSVAFHFTPWGSPTSYMMARYSEAIMGLIGLLVVFLVGQRVAGNLAGLIGSFIWAVDGRVVQGNRQAMLDLPTATLGGLSLLMYLWALDIKRGKSVLLVAAGAIAGLSAMIKLTGLAAPFAIIGYSLVARRGKEAGLLAAGFLGAIVVVCAPFLLLVPEELLKQVVLFQILRPPDGTWELASRMADILGSPQVQFTLLLASIGLLALTAAGIRKRDFGRWPIVILWLTVSMVLMTSSASYYSHYYGQIALPLAVVGGGLASLAPHLLSPLKRRAIFNVAVSLVLVMIVTGPAMAEQLKSVTQPHEDRIYEMVAKYLNYTVHPGENVLAMDADFTFLAAREPTRGPDGKYVIDNYGHMIYLGLGFDRRSVTDLVGSIFKREGRLGLYQVVQRDDVQQDFLSRVAKADYVVTDTKSAGRYTSATLSALEARATLLEKQERYAIYRVTK